MAVESVVKVENCCRVCLGGDDYNAGGTTTTTANNNNNILVPLESRDQSSQIRYADKLAVCVAEVMQDPENSALPKYICTNCIADLRVAYNFRLRCLVSYSVLKKDSDSAVGGANKTNQQPVVGVGTGDVIIKHEVQEDSVTSSSSPLMSVFPAAPPTSVVKGGKRRKKRHLLATRKSTTYYCACKRWFTHAYYLRVHTTNTHGVSCKPHACVLCGMRFTHQRQLRAHIRRHTDEKPYVCWLCDYHTTYRSNLKQHMRAHCVDNTRLQCGQCTKRFRDVYTYVRHREGRQWCRPTVKTRSKYVQTSAPHVVQMMVSCVEDSEGQRPPPPPPPIEIVDVDVDSVERQNNDTDVADTVVTLTTDTINNNNNNNENDESAVQTKPIIEVYQRQKPFKCSVCGRCFIAVSFLRLHMYEHSNTIDDDWDYN